MKRDEFVELAANSPKEAMMELFDRQEIIELNQAVIMGDDAQGEQAAPAAE